MGGGAVDASAQRPQGQSSQLQSQRNVAMLPKAMAHSLQRPQPGARQYPSGTMPSQNMGQQSASGMPSSSLKLKPAMASQFPGEPGVASTTHPKRLNTRISNEPVHVDREGGQSSSYGSPVFVFCWFWMGFCRSDVERVVVINSRVTCHGCTSHE